MDETVTHIMIRGEWYRVSDFETYYHPELKETWFKVKCNDRQFRGPLRSIDMMAWTKENPVHLSMTGLFPAGATPR